jgi:hypothetical protein
MADDFTKDLLAFQGDVQVLVRAHEKFDRVWEDGTDALYRYVQEWAKELEDVRTAFHVHLRETMEKVLKNAESKRYLLTPECYGDVRCALKIMDSTLQVMDIKVDEYEQKMLNAADCMNLNGRLGTLMAQMDHLRKVAGLPREALRKVRDRARMSVCIEWFTRNGEEWLDVHDPATVDEESDREEDGPASQSPRESSAH